MNHKHSGISSPEMFVHQWQVRDFPEGYALNTSLCVLHKERCINCCKFGKRKKMEELFSQIFQSHILFTSIHILPRWKRKIPTQAFY